MFGLIVEKEDSMKKTINNNDIVIIRKNVKQINEGDIIAISTDNNKIIISRIYIIEGKENNQKIIVKGDNNLYPSDELLNIKNIEGKMFFKIPLIGGLINFLQTNIMSVITILILICKFKINIKMKNRRKKSMMLINKVEKN